MTLIRRACASFLQVSCRETGGVGGRETCAGCGIEEAAFHVEAVLAAFETARAESTLELAAMAMLRHSWVTKKVWNAM